MACPITIALRSEVIGQPGILGVPASVLGSDSIAEYTVQELPSADNESRAALPST